MKATESLPYWKNIFSQLGKKIKGLTNVAKLANLQNLQWLSPPHTYTRARQIVFHTQRFLN